MLDRAVRLVEDELHVRAIGDTHAQLHVRGNAKASHAVVRNEQPPGKLRRRRDLDELRQGLAAHGRVGLQDVVGAHADHLDKVRHAHVALAAGNGNVRFRR